MSNSNNKLDYSVILVEPKIEGNIGAIARLCNNFEANELVLVSPLVNHLTTETRNRAKHSITYLEKAKIRKSINEIRDDYSILIGTSAKAGKTYNVLRQPVYPWNLEEIIVPTDCKIGLVFGREDRGLSNDELELCDFLVSIPTPGQLRVLNISHAVAIILYVFWKKSTDIEIINQEEISSTYKERKLLISLFNKITDSLSYEEYRKPIVKHTFRTVINRSFPSKEEIHSMIGIFKTMLQQNIDFSNGD
ncbi:MAG: RNA methyltransferase [Candidatus Heimdallarchaeota archaeon]|nr:RNA methyltransferase [Candidatus Heimdallarchaeota archaeon]MCK4953905.1 RNA methyltransferase [Candidatus Heimdallarchaeota archaeon]